VSGTRNSEKKYKAPLTADIQKKSVSAKKNKNIKIFREQMKKRSEVNVNGLQV
jgi:hypothetical protein